MRRLTRGVRPVGALRLSGEHRTATRARPPDDGERPVALRLAGHLDLPGGQMLLGVRDEHVDPDGLALDVSGPLPVLRGALAEVDDPGRDGGRGRVRGDHAAVRLDLLAALVGGAGYAQATDRGPDRDDAVGSGRGADGAASRALIAGRGDDDNSGLGGGGCGQAERVVAVAVAAEAHVDDIGAVRIGRVDRGLDTGDDVGGVTLARIVHDLVRKEVGARGHAGDAALLGGPARDDAGDMGAVAVVVRRVGVAVDEVVAADDLVSLAESATQVRVAVVDAAVEDGDGDALAVGAVARRVLALPDLRGVDQRHAVVGEDVHLGVGDHGGHPGQLLQLGDLGGLHGQGDRVEQQVQAARGAGVQTGVLRVTEERLLPGGEEARSAPISWASVDRSVPFPVTAAAPDSVTMTRCSGSWCGSAVADWGTVDSRPPMTAAVSPTVNVLRGVMPNELIGRQLSGQRFCLAHCCPWHTRAKIRTCLS